MHSHIIHRARELRREATFEEKLLWSWLKRRPSGCKFRRQVPFDNYIVDFACFSKRLIIEADGAFHDDQPDDVIRDAWFRSEGWMVLRFSNTEIRRNLEGICADIERWLKS
jgi:very-short-patch-repair endonuclease